MANPRAWGQVVTITVTDLSSAKAKSWPNTPSQTSKVITPPDNAMMVSQNADRLARSWVLDLLSWAS